MRSGSVVSNGSFLGDKAGPWRKNLRISGLPWPGLLWGKKSRDRNTPTPALICGYCCYIDKLVTWPYLPGAAISCSYRNASLSLLM
jgi:hypothetical protein